MSKAPDVYIGEVIQMLTNYPPVDTGGQALYRAGERYVTLGLNPAKKKKLEFLVINKLGMTDAIPFEVAKQIGRYDVPFLIKYYVKKLF